MLARLWAGIHYRSDHVYGGRLGRCVARLVIAQLPESCLGRPDGCANPGCDACPPTCEELGRCADEFCRCCREKAKKEQPAPCPPSGVAITATGQEGPGATSGTQEGPAPAGASEAAGEQARSPQQGAAPAGASEAVREQSRSPQQGAG